MGESKAEPDLIRPNRVWAQLGEIFGKSFYREFGEVPPRLWVVAVNRLSDDEIKRGLANIAADALVFPPNLSQFMSACRRLPAVRHLGVPQLEDQRPPGRMPFAEWKKQNEDAT